MTFARLVVLAGMLGRTVAGQDSFQFSTTLRISVTATDAIRTRLQSQLVTKLEAIKGVTVADISHPKHDLGVVVVVATPIIAASVVSAGSMFSEAEDLSGCVSALHPYTVPELQRAWIDAMKMPDHLDMHIVYTSPLNDIEGLAAQIAADFDGTIIEREKSLQFAVWQAKQRLRGTAPSSPEEKK